MKNNQLVTVFRLAVYVNVRSGTTGGVLHAMMLCSVSSLWCVSPDWCRHHQQLCPLSTETAPATEPEPVQWYCTVLQLPSLPAATTILSGYRL